MKYVQLWETPLPLRLVTSSPHHRPQVQRRHSHPFYELALVLSGHCTWQLGRRRVLVHSGEALLLEPGMVHAEETSPKVKAHLAWLGFDFPGSIPSWCQQTIALGDDAAEIAGCFDAIAREHQMTDARTQTRIGLALQSLLLLVERCAEGSRRLAARHSDLNPRQTHTVESAAHYFRNNLQDPLNIAQVAAYHSLCPGHFSALFRQRYRVTPRTFLRQARLQQAVDLLTGSNLTLKEIAGQCGFVDAAHLCKSFRQIRHTTPNQFRAKMRRGL
jgi:AraC-like DNA-binding protein